MSKITLRKFLNRIERETKLYTDTEEVYFQCPKWKIDNQELRNNIIEFALKIGLSENFDQGAGKKLNYISEQGQGYKLTLLKNPQGTLVKIEYTANFNDKVNLPDEVKAHHQRKFLEKFPEAKVKIARLDLAQEFVVKDKHWNDDLTKSFNCPFIKNNKVRYLRHSMQNPRKGRNIGYNDQFTSGRNRAVTHYTGETRTAMDKNYDKTASVMRMYKRGKITPEQYENFIEKWGLTECGTKPKRVIKNELLLRSEALKEASFLITTARQEGKTQEEQEELKKQIKAMWGNEHRLIYVDSIKEGDLYKAKTCEVFEHIYHLKEKKSTKKQIIRDLSERHKIDQEALTRVVQYPSKKRTLDSCLKSLAQELKIEARDQKGAIFNYIETYVTSKLKELVINEVQKDFKNYYEYYSQKSLLAIDPVEKEFYKIKADQIKERGFLYHDMEISYFKGKEGRKIRSWTDEIEQSLMETQLTEEELKKLEKLKS